LPYYSFTVIEGGTQIFYAIYLDVTGPELHEIKNISCTTGTLAKAKFSKKSNDG
jgi:hypothetical protein